MLTALVQLALTFSGTASLIGLAAPVIAAVSKMSRERLPGAPVCFGVYGRGQKGGLLTRGDEGLAQFRR